MARRFLGVILALALAVTLAASAPARLLGHLVPGGTVALSGFSGTLWRGRVSRCLLRVGSGYLHLGSVSWTLYPLSLLTLEPRLRLESRWGQQHIAGDILWRGGFDAELRQFEATVAAGVLRQFAPIVLDGTLESRFDRLRLREGLPVSGRGRLVWREGLWRSPGGPVPLGSYALDIVEGDRGGLAGEVVSLAGPVRAEGSAAMDGRHYAVDILVGETGLSPQLERALSLVATPEAGGYRLRFDGDLQ